MNLSQLLYGVDITETNLESFNIDINSVCGDSRCIEPKDIFISIRGNSYDGHQYIGEALSHGAAVIVTEDRSVTGSFPYIRVQSCRRAYALMWNNLCGRPSKNMKYIAVTGTNGKSSTVAMISHILNYHGIRSADIGTLNASLTTPDPPELYPRLRNLADEGCEYVVMEASSHALEYHKLAPIRFEAGVFTNLTPEHLDFHGDMRSYARAKSRLFSKCGITVYNRDDKYASTVTGTAKRKLSFSFCDNRADYLCRNVHPGLGESSFDFLGVGEYFRVSLPLSGRFNIYNAMAACACAYSLGIPRESIIGSMAMMPPVKGRLEQIELSDKSYSVFIDYAHTPDALSKVLSTVRESTRGRLVCVFGCGGNRDRSKRAPMGNIATTLADRVIITSDNPRNEAVFDIIRDILCGVDRTKPYIVIPDRRGAIRYAIHTAEPGDVILFCGKGHEDYEINSYGKLPFDERKIIQEADKERIGRRGNEHN